MENENIIKLDDILKYIIENQLDCKSRERIILDPRNYLINILHYKFKWSENKIGEFFNRHRTSIINCKDNAYYLKEDENFLNNTKQVKERFPNWVPPEPVVKIKKPSNIVKIQFNLTKAEIRSLKKSLNKILSNL